MNAFASSFSNSAPASLLDAETTSMRWTALGGAGNVVAALARERPEENAVQLREFTLMLQDCPAWKRGLVERSVGDLAAIMQPGMATLLSVNARGGDVRPAAKALYQEFLTARLAIIALLSAVEEN